MTESPESFTQEILRMEPDNGGSRITLACGHVIWTPLEAVYQGGKMYCRPCLEALLKRLKQRPVNAESGN